MTLFICVIAGHAQDMHQKQLTKLQTESQTMQLNQGSKIDQVLSGIRSLEQYVAERKNGSPSISTAMEEIADLEQQISALSLTEKAMTEEQALLRSLTFKSRAERHSSIPQAHRKTFEWVYMSDESSASATSNIAKWLQSDTGLFWVSGKPGSGKSTFMKFIADDKRTRELLAQWSGSNHLVVASHYFWSAGNALQKSENGLLRTLLYDIFRQWSELIVPICGNRRLEQSDQDAGNEFVPWTNSDLRDILKKIAALDAATVRFCFFIDGLDEYDSEYDDLCEILTELSKSPNIKICVSSRPWNVFEDAYGVDEQNKLYMQDLTKNDILGYIRCELSSHRRWKGFGADPSQGDWLIDETQQRASGVFLWVFLVVKYIKEGLTNRDSFSDIKRRLESFPVQLEVFFRQILDSVQSFYWNKMSTMLRMAIAAGEPLHAMAYDFQNQEYEDESYVFGLPTKPYSQDEDLELKELTSCRLDNWTRGLLEMNPHSGVVTFLHRTVLDFLRTRDMSQFLEKKSPPTFRLSLSLLKMYTGLAKRFNFEEPIIPQTFAIYRDCYLQSLTSNALTCVEDEVEGLDSDTNAVYTIVDELDRTILARYSLGHLNFEKGSPPHALLRGQLIKRGFMGFLFWKLPMDPYYLTDLGPSLLHHVVAKDGSKGVALDVPWREHGKEMLLMVLETQNLKLNASSYNIDPRLVFTAWTTLIGHLCSWERGMTNVAEVRFWDLCKNGSLSNMLRGGADPMAILWPTRAEGCPAFGAFLNLAFEIPDDEAYEEIYLALLVDFINAGATLQIPAWTVQSVQRTAGQVRLITPNETFFFRLNSTASSSTPLWSPRLMTRIIKTLMDSVGPPKNAGLLRQTPQSLKAMLSSLLA